MNVSHVFSLCGPGSIPGFGGVLSKHGKKRLNLPSIAPHNTWTSRRKT